MDEATNLDNAKTLNLNDMKITKTELSQWIDERIDELANQNLADMPTRELSKRTSEIHSYCHLLDSMSTAGKRKPTWLDGMNFLR